MCGQNIETSNDHTNPARAFGPNTRTWLKQKISTTASDDLSVAAGLVQGWVENDSAVNRLVLKRPCRGGGR
jgi:hypothetical protein